MYRVEFENEWYEIIPIEEHLETIEDCNRVIMNELGSRGIQPYYIRTWEKTEGITMVDYGSHSRFYRIVNEEACK